MQSICLAVYPIYHRVVGGPKGPLGFAFDMIVSSKQSIFTFRVGFLKPIVGNCSSPEFTDAIGYVEQVAIRFFGSDQHPIHSPKRSRRLIQVSLNLFACSVGTCRESAGMVIFRRNAGTGIVESTLSQDSVTAGSDKKIRKLEVVRERIVAKKQERSEGVQVLGLFICEDFKHHPNPPSAFPIAYALDR